MFDLKPIHPIRLKALISICIISVIVGGIAFYFIVRDGQLQNSQESSKESQNSISSDQVVQAIPDNFILKIESLGVSAPIILNVNASDTNTYLKALESGVAHMQDSALPGKSGNAVIFGHSSYYADKPGDYKTILATLNKLNIGDKIIIQNNNDVFQYVVIQKRIVSPSDVSVVKQDRSKHWLTLITCWPPGTIEKRLVVAAELVNN